MRATGKTLWRRVREDYYSGAGEAPGQWVGRADQFGRIPGETVTAVESALLLEALSAPDGTVLGQKVSTKIVNAGTPLEKKLEPVTALDLTFSAPKSVSTLWAAPITPAFPAGAIGGSTRLR